MLLSRGLPRLRCGAVVSILWESSAQAPSACRAERGSGAMFRSLKGLTSARVLVVDHHSASREELVGWLKEAGCVCAAADSCDAGWELLQDHAADLVVLDIAHPGSSSPQLLERILTNVAGAAVLVVAEPGRIERAFEAIAKGATGYVLRPVDRRDLVLQTQRALERRQLILDNRAYMQYLEQEVRRHTLEARRAHEETVYRLLAAAASRDGETAAHVRRTGLYSEVLAEMAGWPLADSENIRLAAPMHDIGKIGVPDAVLSKPGKLTEEEFELMKSHAEIGARLLSGSNSPMLQMAEQVARHHHERWDGKGYPSGLAGTAIPQCARIVAIVDVFDALSHARAFRPAMPEDQVLSILEEGRGTHFDADLLALFFQSLPEMRKIAHDNPDELPSTEPDLAMALSAAAAGAQPVPFEPLEAATADV
jgi:putative two-component system response regulator